MKRLGLILFFLLGLAGFAQAQVQPDCFIQVSATTTGRLGGPPGAPTSGYDNRLRGCTSWTMNVTSTGFSVTSVLFSSAPDSSGAAGTWVSFAGTVVSGSNPSTTTTSSTTTFTGFYPWISVNPTTLTGTGTVTISIAGSRASAGSTSLLALESGGNLATIATNTGTSATNTGTTATQTTTTATQTTALNTVLGTTADAAATAGSTGTEAAKLRLMTSQLDSIKTAVESTSPVAISAAAASYAAQAFAVGAIPPSPGILISGAISSAMTSTTSTQVIAGTASNYQYITNCVTSNGSTTVSTDILLQDGSGGTTLYVLPAPAASVATTGGGGGTFTFPYPLKVTTSGNGLFAANVTTGSSTKISCSGTRSTVSY